ncbi:MAG: response regulator [Acidimicrobiales bacterium]
MEASSEEPSAERIRVLIADDQAVFRRGLLTVLGLEDDIEVVGEAENGPEAIDKTDELAPDVVLMDVRMPGTGSGGSGGIEAARAISALAPTTRIVMLTASDEEEDLYEAIKAGASGYLLKEISVDDVPQAVRSANDGQSTISPSMASKLLIEFNALAKRPADRKDDAMVGPELTQRELQVLRLVARGMSNREVGNELFIAENTVKNHVRNILEKLHLHSRMQAVMYALKQRIIES